MAWNGDNSTISGASKNYMYQDKVFILDVITSENCAFLIGDLTAWVFNKQNVGNTLTFIINSPGGEVSTMKTIMGLMNIAKLSNIEILTFVMGEAGSAASLIALHGTQRLITRYSRHFIHFGQLWDCTTKHSEIEKIYNQNKEYSESMMEMYIDLCKGKLSRNKLIELQDDERGYLTAADCLKYGLCEMVIEDDLDEKINLDIQRIEFEGTFESFLKEKLKKQKLENKKSGGKNAKSK